MANNSNFQAVSYYTVDTPYQQEVKKLIASLNTYNVPYHIYSRPNLSSWAQNTCQKIDVLQQAMQDYPDKNIVWIDADAEVKAYPALFNDLMCDFACHIKPRNLNRPNLRGLCAGTLFIRNCPTMLSFLSLWQQENERGLRQDPRHTDQEGLYRTLGASQFRYLYFEALPAAYTHIFDDPISDRFTSVICHYQASRKYKRIIR